MRPVPVKDWDASLQPVIEDMQGSPLNVHSLMANHPALLNAWWSLRQYLVQGGDLEQRQCEIVILRVAVNMRSWYEWASHVVRGLDSGLSKEEIDRLQGGGGQWDKTDYALIAAVDELTRTNAIGENTRKNLADHFTDRQVMDIVLLHGMYLTLGCMINTWGLELDDHVSDRLPEKVTEASFLGATGV